MITPARIEALDTIGFDWGREGCSDLVDWEVRYEELRLYKEENGHCRVPRAFRENQQLGNWVHTQVWDSFASPIWSFAAKFLVVLSTNNTVRLFSLYALLSEFHSGNNTNY